MEGVNLVAEDSWGFSLDRLEFNDAGAREVLRSGAVQGILRERADAIAQRAGGDNDAQVDFGVEVHAGGSRARAIVYTATYEARYLEAAHRVLLSAVH